MTDGDGSADLGVAWSLDSQPDGTGGIRMAVDAGLLDRRTTPARWTWSARDCAMYALALGADFEDRAFLMTQTAGAGQLVYATFPLSLVSLDMSSRRDPMLGVVRPEPGSTVLLGRQSLELHRPIAPSGVVDVSAVATDLQDKGSGALLVLECRGETPDDGAPLFTARMEMFVLGEGGFGGARTRSAGRPVPDRAPDATVRVETSPVQCLLYMVAGNDEHAIHVDPATASAAGFAAPILPGQNTLGFACRAVTRSAADGDPTRIRSIDAKMRKPVPSGDPLTVQLWFDGVDGVDGASAEATARFRVVDDAGDAVLDEGLCELGAW
jgi:acyl dehydratase